MQNRCSFLVTIVLLKKEIFQASPVTIQYINTIRQSQINNESSSLYSSMQPIERISHHIDVYQGKNLTNAHVVQEARNQPTTEKPVVNLVISSGINNDPHGMSECTWTIGILPISYLSSFMRNTKSWLVK